MENSEGRLTPWFRREVRLPPWLRRLAARLDRSLPLVVKVGIPTVAIAGLATAAVGRKLIEVTGGHKAEEALVVLALGTGGIAISCVLILYAFVLRRTARLARVAKMVAQGNFDFRLPEGEGPRGHDALYNFCRSFDRMVRALDKRAWAVTEAEERYRTMVERIPAVAYTSELGSEGRWSYVAPQIESVLGFSAEEWQADPSLWSRQLHEDDRSLIIARRDGSKRGERHVTMEYRIHARDRHVVWVHDEAVVVTDPSGRAKELQGVLYDITERKEAEDTLQQAYEREREAATRLRSVDEMKNAFLTAVSHELRTPLASVLGYGITLAQEDVDFPEADRRDMLQRLVRNAKRLETLLGDLLDVDRMSRGILEPRRHPTNLAELAHRVLAQADLQDRPIAVDVDPVTIEVDAPMVERILENLLMNAGKHTAPGTAVRLSIQRVEDGAMIAVDDHGRGVPDELKETVFLPFERGPEAPTHAPGTGIGLSLVSRFAELHGGRAWVDDAPGGGASFRVFLPAAAAPAPSETVAIAG
jgi:PAS domain S-box-containing protein